MASAADGADVVGLEAAEDGVEAAADGHVQAFIEAGPVRTSTDRGARAGGHALLVISGRHGSAVPTFKACTTGSEAAAVGRPTSMK